MTPEQALRTACECCAGRRYLTPVEISNRPGLPSPTWRVGTHARFKASMLAGLSGKARLGALTTRRDDDVTIGLLDAWAAVLDVLTFYQGQIGDEGFLRTAKERRSVLELARLIGYQLNPGVAAAVRLAFTLDDSPGSPSRVVIPVGTRAQSLPAEQGELPQSFETGEEITAYPEWNALAPRLTEPQALTIHTTEVWLDGVAAGVAADDRLLLVLSGGGTHVRRVTAVAPEPQARRTRLTLAPLEPVTEPPPPPRPSRRPDIVVSSHAVLAAKLEEISLGPLFARPGLRFRGAFGVALEESLSEAAATTPEDTGLFAFDVEAAVFGHAAPAVATLPEAWTESGGPFHDVDWDASEPAVHENARGVRLTTDEARDVVDLDGDRPEAEGAGWALFERPGGAPAVLPIQGVSRRSRADFGLSGKVTRLTVPRTTGLDAFTFRSTLIRAGSRRLALAEKPLDAELDGDSIELSGEVEPPILPGHVLLVSGAPIAAPATTAHEWVEVAESGLSKDGHTVLAFTRELSRPYLRETVRLNANTAPATHGESRRQVLGSGDGSAKFQRFPLADAPLTFTPAPVPSGGESTLEVRVDGVRWRRAERFVELGPDDRAYVLRRAADGVTSVLFGDGIHGARLTTGTENVHATYRVGTGLAGRVDAQRITLLPKRPLGVRGVVNPLAAEGGGEPEGRDAARANAPVTVLTLDRIVALRDFEDFARAFAGVWRARADLLREGLQQKVLVTVVPEGGGALGETLREDLGDAMDAVRDRAVPLDVLPFTPRLIRLSVRLEVHPDHLAETVVAAVEAALLATFGLDAARLGRSVESSRVHAVAHAVPGVVAVDLDVFTLGSAAGVVPRLDARPAGRGAGGGLAGAELLYLDPSFLDVEPIEEVSP